MKEQNEKEKKWEKYGLIIGAIVTCLVGLIILESVFIYDYYNYSNSVYSKEEANMLVRCEEEWS